MSAGQGSSGRQQQLLHHNGAGPVWDREATSASNTFMLVTSPDTSSLQQASYGHKNLAAVQTSGAGEGESLLLCRETLPSISPSPPLRPQHEAQLSAQVHHLASSSSSNLYYSSSSSSNNINTFAQLPSLADSSLRKQTHLPAREVQYALILPEAYLAANPHLLARATLVTTTTTTTSSSSSSGEDVRGAAGAVVFQTAEAGGQVRGQDEVGGRRLLVAGPTLLREVVSLTPGPGFSGGSVVLNGLEAGVAHKLFTSSTLLLSSDDGGVSGQHQRLSLVGPAQVTVQQTHTPAPQQQQHSASPSLLQQQQQANRYRHSQQQQQLQEAAESPLSPSPVSEGMHSGRPPGGAAHNHSLAPAGSSGSSPDQSSPHPPPPPTMLSSAGASNAGLGLVFRGGSLTHGEPASRVLAAQFSSSLGGGSPSLGLYSTSPSSASASSSSSSLYGVHAQASPLASMPGYPGFFTAQYPVSTPSPYTQASLVASPGGRYPHIESYSAVLASMGNQVQHGGSHPPPSPQGQRSPFLPMVHYSHRPLPAALTSSPSTHSPSGTVVSFATLREREAMMQQQQRELRERSPPQHQRLSPPDAGDEKGPMHHYRGPASAALLKEVKVEGRGAEPYHKVPSGKEGSLKHRILTRPSELEGYPKVRSQSMKVEEECDGVRGKRARYMSSVVPAASGTPSSPPDPHVFLAPHALGPGPQTASSTHYPSGLPHHGIHPHPHLNHAPPNPTLGFSLASTTATHIPSPSFSSSSAAAASSASPSPSSSSAAASPPPPPVPASPLTPHHLHYPPHFIKGSIIQLANGDLKRVEDLQTEDFVSSAQVSADLKVDSSTVVRIEEHPENGTATLGFSVGEHRVQVTVEATLEHPFFVFGQGWSSCSTERTLKRYGLECHRLAVGDVCISLTHKDVTLRAAEISSQQQQQQQRSAEESAQANSCRQEATDKPQDVEGQTYPPPRQGNGQGAGSDAGVDLSARGGSRSLVHAQSLEGAPGNARSASPREDDPASCQQQPDTRPLRKRRWSAPESDGDKENSELEKQKSDPSQND